MVVDILGTEYTVTRNTSAIEDMGVRIWGLMESVSLMIRKSFIES